MWSKGTLQLGKQTIQYWVKHFEEESEVYGLDGGRISKLSIKCDGRWIAEYDRGWDTKPNSSLAKKALSILKKKFN